MPLLQQAVKTNDRDRLKLDAAPAAVVRVHAPLRRCTVPQGRKSPGGDWSSRANLAGMSLAGVSLSDDLVVELAQRLQSNGAQRTAQALLKAATSGSSAAALDAQDRKNILAVLDHPPAGLEELQGVLLREIRRRREVP